MTGQQTARYTVGVGLLLNANERLHHMAHADRVRDLVQVGRLAFGRQLTPPGERVHVEIVYRLPPDVRGRSTANKRRDAANWAPTSKALIDGMTLAGLWPDDNDRYVEGPDNRLGPATDRPLQAEIHVILTPKPKVDKPKVETVTGARPVCAAYAVRPFSGGETRYFCTREPHDDDQQHRAVSETGTVTWVSGPT